MSLARWATGSAAPTVPSRANSSGSQWLYGGHGVRHASQAPADAWVQAMKAPTPPHAVQAPRPMCRYPNYPRHVGGDAKLASSFICTPSPP